MEPLIVLARDAVPLGATVFVPPEGMRPTAVVIVNSGAGIPQRFYRHFARALASAGMAVFTYDYRGIGASRPRKGLRRYTASVEDWGSKDCAALLNTGMARFPGLPLAVIGHSIGAFVTGFVTEPRRIGAMLCVSGHTGYWADYGQPYRYPMTILWHLLMPAVTRSFGYFPGRRLGFPEDLPRGVALEWAGRLRPDFGWNLKDSSGRHDQTRANELRDRFKAIRVPLMALRIEDDAFATEEATARLLSLYARCAATVRTINARQHGLRSLGHFGFFHKSSHALWSIAVAWILQELVETRQSYNLESFRD